MKNLLLFLNKIKFFVFFFVLQLFVFKLIVSKSSYQQSGFLNSSASVSGWFYKKEKSIKEYFNLSEQNKILANQNALLKQESLKNYFLVSENVIEVDKKKYQSKYLFQPASVIKNSTVSKKNILTLDVGKNKGVKNEMGVLSSKGVIGIVKNVSEHYSTVISMMNIDFNIPVKPKNIDCVGKVYWDKSDPINQVSVKGIPNYFKIKIGDSIISQSGAGIFPPDELVGIVKEILEEVGSNKQVLKLKTSVDFNALNHVFISRNELKEELDSIQSTAK